MATYDSNHVKNIALLGHPGSGKTTLAESMLFEAGLIKRRGSVLTKNTAIAWPVITVIIRPPVAVIAGTCAAR